MPDLTAELTAFMAGYARATNSHDVAEVQPHIAPDASYWFSDGSFQGLAEITRAIERTFATIQQEVYTISDLHWILVSNEHAVCRYRFSWTGLVGGQPRSGAGRGTNVLERRNGNWLMLHEHLSP